MNSYSLLFQDHTLQKQFNKATTSFAFNSCKVGMVFCELSWFIQGIIAIVNAKFWITIVMLVAFVIFIPLFYIVYAKRRFYNTFLTLILLASLITHLEVLIADPPLCKETTFPELYNQPLAFLNIIVIIVQTSWISQAAIVAFIQVYYIIRLHFAEEPTPIHYNWGIFLFAQIIFFYLLDKSKRELFLHGNYFQRKAEQLNMLLDDHIQDKLIIVNKNLKNLLFFNKPVTHYFHTNDEAEILANLNLLKPKPSTDILHNLDAQNKREVSLGLLDVVSTDIVKTFGTMNDLEDAFDQKVYTLSDYYNTQENQESLIDITVKQIVWEKTPAYLVLISELSEKVIANRLKIADIFKNRLIASFSNEFRTPLNGILGFVSLLKRKYKSTRDMEVLDLVESNAKVLLVSIDSLLDLMMLVKDQKLKLKVKPIRTKVFAEEVQHLILPYFQNRNVSYNFEIGKDMPEVFHSDEDRLKEALIHLLLNAIKFTFNGYITLSIRRCPEDPDIALFSVEDTGVGIKPDDIPNLFKLNLKDDRDDLYQKGVGLGLQISKKLAKLLGKAGSKHSNILVQSEYGKGSKFTIGIDMSKLAQKAYTEVVHVASEGHLSIDLNVALRNQSLHNEYEIVEVIPNERGFYDKKVKIFRAHDSLDFGGSEENIPPERLTFNHVLPPKSVFQDLNSHENLFKKDIRARGPGKKELVLPDKFVVFQSEDIIPNPIRLKPLVGPLAISPAISHPLPYLSTMHHVLDKADASPQEQVNEKESILVVDDTSFNLLVAKRFLEELGYSVKTALNGKEAIEMVVKEDKTNFFKVIFMDCQMPIMDGYQATALLKDKMMKNEIPLTPIIAITANKNQVDIDRCFEAGMDGYLSKPITKEILRNQIKELFPEAKI